MYKWVYIGSCECARDFLFAVLSVRGFLSQIQQAVQLIAQRNASAEEVADMRAYADQHGLENLCRVLFNLSEFVFLD